jgi:hypothetical protein
VVFTALELEQVQPLLVTVLLHLQLLLLLVVELVGRLLAGLVELVGLQVLIYLGKL